ncbi:sensor histidine kinase [Tautonia sociabilis]|uniref:histidine kinase n=1 Tax=Tautonia sociabilis TaxID=2080755 RepID=A0A432MF13_9BACT|nr:ATP-binding protein [Tautonia sociabilis]RUL84366.1 HAMP domain-containing protein [Tautonia sociabilis]
MSSAKSRPLGLRAKLTAWSSLVLGASLAAGFAWVHHGLRSVLEARDDAFLYRKAAELSAVVRDYTPEGSEALEAEIRREVLAYQSEGLVVVLREPGRVFVAPETEQSRGLARRLEGIGSGATLETLALPASGRYRVLRAGLAGDASLDLGLSLAETESTLAQFDRRVAFGGLFFLGLSVVGGAFLSRQALRPVAQSIQTAKRLEPSNLSERLPRTGAGDELDELAGTINELLDRLAAYHGQIIRFTADASHELRSPLGAMRAAVEVALGQPREPGEYREVLASLGEQCERLTALVNGLLLLARADAGEMPLRREPVDLSALASDVAEMYEPLAEERGVRFRSECGSPVPVLGDSGRLRQLVTNLVDNAIKFTEPGGSVTLRVGGAGDQARLVVEDTGVGIAPDHLPHVFERFYQADSARSLGGSGLGLSICRWIVEAHGGSVEATSRSGSGSAFVVSLPRAAAAPEKNLVLRNGHA